MSIHRLQITAAPEQGAVVHVDLVQEGLVSAQADGFSLGSPDVAFDESGYPLESARQVTIPLHITGDRASVGVLMQQVARAISVPDRWLCVQRTPSTDPAWFRLRPTSPGDLDIVNAFVDARHGFWSWTLQLTVDSTAVGQSRAVPMVGATAPESSITNTGMDRGVVLDVPGEAPSPLLVSVRPSVTMNGRRPMISAFAVPWDSPLVNGGRPAIIREDSDFASVTGHSTRTTGHASMSGGSAITVTLDTTAVRQMAVTASGSTWRPEPGRYLVLARLYREGGGGEVRVRMGQSWGSVTARQDWRAWRPPAGASRASWMPIGYLQHPLGDSGAGLRPSEIMPPVIRIDVAPTVTSSTGLLHLDQVAFVPVELARGANVSACFSDFADGIGFGDTISLRVDAEHRRVGVVDGFGQHHAVPQPRRTGGWPVGTPGMATCVSVFLDTSDAPAGIDSVATTSTLRVDCSPRLLHLGQER